MAQIKLAEYTFDNSLGDCFPTFTGISAGEYTYEDTVNGNITTRILYTTSTKTITRISFQGKTSLLTVSYLINTKYANNMFNGCVNLTSINVPGWNITGGATYENMFYNCSSLKSLDLSSFTSTSTVTNMGTMFYSCKSLTYLNLSSFDTTSLTTANAMFSGCTSLQELYLTSFDTSKITNSKYMFEGWKSSQKVYISSKWTLRTTDFTPTFITTFANIIAKYKFDQSTYESFIPTFNTDFTDYTYNDEIDTDGYTIRTIGNDSGNLPILMKFGNSSNTSSTKSLLEVYKCNTSEMTNMAYMFANCRNLTSLDLSSFNTENVLNMSYMFYNCHNITSLNFSSFNTEKVTTMSRMFYTCKNLTSLDLSSFNTQNVTDMSNMFYGCQNLTSLDVSSFNTQNVTTMSYMFYACSKLTSLNLPNFDTQKVTSMSYMFDEWTSSQKVYISSKWTLGTEFSPTFITTFANIITKYKFNQNTNESFIPAFNTDFIDYYITDEIDTDGYTIRTIGNDSGSLPTQMRFGDSSYTDREESLLEVYKCNTSAITSMSYMFQNCRKLTSLDLSSFNTQNVTDMNYMFSTCSNLTSLDLSSFNTENVIGMNRMFYECLKLTSLNLSNFNTEKVTSMSRIFYNCKKLTSLDLSSFNTEKVTDMARMFYCCEELTSLNISSFNTQNVTDMSNMFYSCSRLTSLDLSNFNTQKTTNMTYMFYNCKNLTSLDLSSFNTEKVMTMTSMFNYCLNLTSLDISNFNTEKVTDMSYMFNNCYSLNSLDLKSFNTQKVTDTNYMFTGWSSSQKVYISSKWTLGRDFPPTFIITLVYTIAKYKFDQNRYESFIPTFNDDFTDYVYNDEIDTDGYTIRTLGNDSGSLPTLMQFGTASVETKSYSLLSVLKCNTDNIISMSEMFNNSRNLTSINLSSFNTQNVTNMGAMFKNCTSLTSLDLSNFNTNQVTSMGSMFYGCSNLTSLDLSSFNTEKITNTYGMFYGCSNLTSLNLSSFNTEKITSMNSMFYGCQKLTSLDLSNFNTQSVTNMSDMFKNCSSLTSLDLSSWDTSSCTSIYYMFDGCGVATLNLKGWDTSKVKDMQKTFSNMKNITTLDLSHFDTSNVDNMQYVISNCPKLTYIDVSSFTRKASLTNINYLFLDNLSLESIDISNFDMTNMSTYMFRNSSKLKTIGMLYSSAESINKLVASGFSNYRDGITIYYYDADPSQLTPVEGVTFKKYQATTTIQLPPHIQLHGLPDGTRDEVDIKTGILTRNVGAVTFTGDEQWDFYNGHFYMYHDYAEVQKGLCDKMPVYHNFTGNPYGIFVDNSVFRMSFGDNNEDVGIFKQKLKLLLPTLLYKKKTPTTEQLILNYNNSCDYGRILPTGMCDKYDVVDSIYTQTMTSILLDGANTWDAMEEFENTVKFTATGTTVGVENLNMLGAGGLYCDNDLFPNINDDSDVPHCRVDEAGNKFYIYVDKEMLMSPDLIGWQIWLQENKFNMIYELTEHLTYVKPYEELDATQARWEGMDCMRDSTIKYHTNSSDNITIYPTLEYVAPSINNFEVTMLEPNTDYTIYAEGINTNDTINLGGTDINFNNGTVYTSGDNQWLRIDNNDSFYNMVITKGDTTGEVVPYFEGMTSVENPKVRTPNKNLFILQDYDYIASWNGQDPASGKDERNVARKSENGTITFTSPSHGSYASYNIATGEYYYSIIGAEIDNYDYAKTQTMVEGAGTYTIQLDVNHIEGQVPETYVYYDDDKKKTYHWRDGHNYSLKLTVEKKINFIAVVFWYEGRIVNTTISNIQVEKGEVATDYVRGGGSTVSYTNLKLRSLPNGVKDTINVVTGEYVQRVGEVVLDGSQTLQPHSEVQGDTLMIKISDPSISFKQNSNLQESWDFSDMICDKELIAETPKWNANEWNEGYNIALISSAHTAYDTNSFVLAIRKSYFNVQSIDEFKTWLTQNPVTVQYELAEPIITKLDPQTLLAYTDGTINLSSDAGLLPTTHYTVPSTNTFHLPSMKTGTRYTLKYPSASGSITIGDINYSISSDSMLFTTPLKINGDTSAIIFSDANPENVVLLEGAYNKREVPFFTGVKSVKNPNITIIDQLSTESTTYNCETEIELRGLPNGVADKLDIIKGKLTTNVGIRPYQEGDENLPNIWTDGYETVYALSSPVVTNVAIDQPTVTTNSLIELSSDYLIPQLNYRAPSSNNFPLDLLQPNQTYTLYADTLTSGSYTLGGTKTGIYSQPHTITLGDMTDNLLTFNGDLGLSNVMLVKGNSLKTTLPPYFLGIRSVTDGHLLVEGMAGEINELTFDEGIVLRDNGIKKDTIDLITGVLTKRTGEITLTGVEGWSLANTSEVIPHNDYVTFQLILGGVAYSNPASNGALICDTLKHEYQLNMTHEKEGIYSRADVIRICVKKSRIGGDTVDALKSWLNQNPTTVVYTLKTPLEVQLENTWTTTPPTSYNNQTEISSTVSSNSLKPMISVTIATTTLEEIVSNLETRNAQLEEENLATMLALTEVYEMMYMSTVDDDTEPTSVSTWNRRIIVSSIGMVYAKLVKRGVKSIEDIPTKLQVEVQYAIDNGLV